MEGARRSETSGGLGGNRFAGDGGDELDYIAVGSTVLIPVAAPDHPLAQGVNPPGAGRGHTQLVLTDPPKVIRKLLQPIGSEQTTALVISDKSDAKVLLELYRDGRTDEIPVLRMLCESARPAPSAKS